MPMRPGRNPATIRPAPLGTDAIPEQRTSKLYRRRQFTRRFGRSPRRPNKTKKNDLHRCKSFSWYHQESNRGHKDFQSFALPTELWHHPPSHRTRLQPTRTSTGITGIPFGFVACAKVTIFSGNAKKIELFSFSHPQARTENGISTPVSPPTTDMAPDTAHTRERPDPMPHSPIASRDPAPKTDAAPKAAAARHPPSPATTKNGGKKGRPRRNGPKALTVRIDYWR